jgi:hypothetical protein
MEMTSPIERRSARQAKAEEPMLAGEKTRTETFLVKLLAVVPLLALTAAMPFAWGWGWAGGCRRQGRPPGGLRPRCRRTGQRTFSTRLEVSSGSVTGRSSRYIWEVLCLVMTIASGCVVSPRGEVADYRHGCSIPPELRDQEAGVASKLLAGSQRPGGRRTTALRVRSRFAIRRPVGRQDPRGT